MKDWFKICSIGLATALMLVACGGQQAATGSQAVSYSLRTDLQDGKMVFIGVGGDIDGMVNPTLKADVGDTVNIKLTSGDGAEHNIAFPDFNVDSPHVSGQGNSIAVSFLADKGGSFVYYCSMPGHREAGMEGRFVVAGGGASAAAEASPVAPNNPDSMPAMDMTSAPASTSAAVPATGEDIVRDPSDLPGPLGDRGPTAVRIDLEAEEVVGQLADGTTYPYWTFNGKVPGPFFRVRVGDTVEVHLKNDANSIMPHSVDFHAVTGPGGGAVFTTTAPGKETVFTFKALNPGLYMYHCATPMVAEHIANGMYGLILVEPEGGLPKVDHEFYVDQGEIYTTGQYGEKGAQTIDVSKLLNETPEYYVFNGAVGALTTEHPLKASVGQTIRIFLGNAGPNKISSFHIIGEIMDRVYDQGSLTSPPLTNVQTTLVPAGGAAMIELQFQVPGKYTFLDHAIARMERGLMGWIIVDGPPAPDIFNGTPMPGSGH
ncbi:MAG TPA: copper-containing nitrite reductase [Anaerolineales bacterium]|nr:copper-containing nitrite reductase [Anaerolineales bacterium]